MTRVISFKKVQTKEYKILHKIFANFRIWFLKDINKIMEDCYYINSDWMKYDNKNVME